jgi:serine protease
MRVIRARTVCVTLLVAAGLVLGLRGQTPESRLFFSSVGLPGIDTGAIADQRQTPASRDAARRADFDRSLERDLAAAAPSSLSPRVIVKFRDEAASERRRDAVQAASDGSEILTRQSYADFDIVRISADADPEAVARALSTRPEVEYAQAVHRFHATFVPNDPLYSTMQWNLPMLNLERAWDIQPQAGSSITVAVLDTGMAFRDLTISANLPAFRDEFGTRYPALGPVTIPYSAAPQLVGAAGAGRVVAPYDVLSGGINPPLDFDGHGTHVSGTIGQLTNDGIGTAGVAFNVKLMPVKVLASEWDVLFRGASGIGGSDDDIARGLRYAADNGAKIINMSLGGSGPPDCATNSNRSGCAPVIEAAMRYAVSKGSFIVVAGGNEFEDNVPPFGVNPTSVLAEIASRIPGVISVAAVDRAKNHAYYSSSGPYIEIAAPGGSERGFVGGTGFVRQQTFDFNFTDTFLLPPSAFRAPRFDMFGYIGYIGTSMAAPHVAGVAAMMMQQGITDPAAIEDALEKFAVDLGTPGRDDMFGFGLVDARASLRGLGIAK